MTDRPCTVDDVDAYDRSAYHPNGAEYTEHIATCHNCDWHENHSELGDAEAAAHRHWWRTCPFRHLEDVFDNVRTERERQQAKWGEQNHPDGTGDGVPLLHGRTLPKSHSHVPVTMGTLAYVARRVTDEAAQDGTVTYADIFLEEAGEALAESDPVLLEAELIQVAAVAVAWIEKIRRYREAQSPEDSR